MDTDNNPSIERSLQVLQQSCRAAGINYKDILRFIKNTSGYVGCDIPKHLYELVKKYSLHINRLQPAVLDWLRDFHRLEQSEVDTMRVLDWLRDFHPELSFNRRCSLVTLPQSSRNLNSLLFDA